jgi:hypothetical protein
MYQRICKSLHLTKYNPNFLAVCRKGRNFVAKKTGMDDVAKNAGCFRKRQKADGATSSKSKP